MDVDFENALVRCLAQVVRGRIVTCGVIARALGDTRAARSVATWLLDHPDTRGGHRVVRSDGRPVLTASWSQLAREGIRSMRGRVPTDRLLDELEPIGFLTALRQEQDQLSLRVVERDEPSQVEYVAGVDAAYDGDAMFVVAACLDSKSLAHVEVAEVRHKTEFPYIPTYLACREFPGIEAAVRRLTHRPDVLMIDGHGRLHPALFGIACHVGVRMDLPTIGVAKHALVGRVMTSQSTTPDAFPIEFRGHVRGYAWTPPGRSRPIFVSVGNRISLVRALEIVRGTTRHGYPEPLKLADRICREMKRNEKRERGTTR